MVEIQKKKIVNYQLIKLNCQFDNIGNASSNTIIEKIIKVWALMGAQTGQHEAHRGEFVGYMGQLRPLPKQLSKKVNLMLKNLLKNCWGGRRNFTKWKLFPFWKYVSKSVGYLLPLWILLAGIHSGLVTIGNTLWDIGTIYLSQLRLNDSVS